MSDNQGTERKTFDETWEELVGEPFPTERQEIDEQKEADEEGLPNP